MDWNQFLNLTIRLSSPILLLSMGGLFSFQVDIFNMAQEGFLLFGCFASIVGAYITNSVLGGVIFAILITLVIAGVYSVMVLELKVNSIICAISIITISSGLTRYLLIPIFSTSGRFVLSNTLSLTKIHLPFLDKIPFIGPMLNNHSMLVYIGLILPFVVHFLLYKTPLGLSIRAVGLNRQAAEATGVPAKKLAYLCLGINGILAGLAGAQLALSLNLFNVGMSNGRGFTALAVLILTTAKPIRTFCACLLFGLSDAIVLTLSGEGYPIQILSMLPYVLALLVAVVPPLIAKLNSVYKQKIIVREI